MNPEKKIENGRISGRQLGRLCFYNFLAVPGFVLPAKLAATVGNDGIFSLALGLFAGYLLLCIVGKYWEKFPDMRGLWYALCTPLALAGAVYSLRLICHIGVTYLTGGGETWLILAVTLLLGCYGLCAGPEARARRYELLFWLLLIPLLYFLALSATGVKMNRWLPVAAGEGAGIWAMAGRVLLFFLSIFFIPLLGECAEDVRAAKRAVKKAYLFSGALLVALYLLLLGCFGANTVKNMQDPALMLAVSRISWGLLERRDALLCGLWFLMIYAFAENCGYVLYRCVNPLLQRHKKLLVGLPLLLFVLCLMGCQRLEIEERAFPLAMAVRTGEGEGLYEFSFFFEENDSDASNRKNTTVQAAGYPEAFALFERSQAGQVDTSHMQVILLQEELLEDTEFLEGLYGALIREQHFSWNTLVYLLDDDSMDAETLAACTDGRPGSYLRQVAESSGDQPVLGDLYMEWNNREQTLLLPVLSGKAAMADHYRLLIHGELGECLPADEAGLSVSAPLS